MPPKVKITKEEILHAALTLTRERGAQAINARTLAAFLQCSTQPIFSNFATMDELWECVIAEAGALYVEYTKREIALDCYPPYKATGMAYIRFAKEEPELFKLLLMRDRSKEDISKETEFDRQIAAIVQSVTGLEEDVAKRFHLEVWAFVHGIATMLATEYLTLDTEFISQMITDVYRGLRLRYGIEE